MRIFNQLVILMLLLVGCVKRDCSGTFSELPQSAAGTSQQAYPMPERAPEPVRQKALAAYAKTHWIQIYPEMRGCGKVEGTPGYFAFFGKSGQALARFTKDETKWDAIEVEFDDALHIVKLYRVRY